MPEHLVWTPDMDAELSRLALAGAGRAVIARRLGVAQSVVRKRRQVLGLPTGKLGGPRQRAGNFFGHLTNRGLTALQRATER